MLLTDTAIKNFKPSDKLEKLRDGGGLFLHVQPNGTKRFVMAYRFGGKQKSFALGVYPDVGLKEARRRHSEARTLLAAGVDPAQARKEQRDGQGGPKGNITFGAMAKNWFHFYKRDKKEVTVNRSWMLLEKYVFPGFEHRKITEISRIELVRLIEGIGERGFMETAEKTARLIQMVFDRAVNRGIMEYSVAQRLTTIIPSHKVQHRAAILNPADFGRLLVNIDDLTRNSPAVKYCLQIMPYVFVRSSELRCAKWSEINMIAHEWIIPAERMKMKEPHLVPLARQVSELLGQVQSFSGSNEYLFPSTASRSKPLSDGALRVALRTMGYPKEQASIHGFRSTASTLLHEMKYDTNVIERQLAHRNTNAVRDAYNFAEFKAARVAMMQEWADYLDDLKLSVVRS